MKVLCINDKTPIGKKSPLITKGNWYQVIDRDKSGIYLKKLMTHIEACIGQPVYHIISDNGTTPAVEKSKFISIEEYRSQQINKILFKPPS
jgi:hypothetical protein